MTHYRVIRERWTPVGNTYAPADRLDTTDRKEAERFYRAACDIVRQGSDPERVLFGWCPPAGSRFRWSRKFEPRD